MFKYQITKNDLINPNYLFFLGFDKINFYKRLTCWSNMTPDLESELNLALMTTIFSLTTIAENDIRSLFHLLHTLSFIRFSKYLKSYFYTNKLSCNFEEAEPLAMHTKTFLILS